MSHRGTILRQGHRHSRANRTSLEPMSIHLQSDTNPVPIDCQSNVNQVPIHPNPMPIKYQSGAGQVAIHCQCSANHVPIHFQSNANPGQIRHSITDTPFLWQYSPNLPIQCQYVDTTEICQSSTNPSIPCQSRTN